MENGYTETANIYPVWTSMRSCAMMSSTGAAEMVDKYLGENDWRTRKTANELLLQGWKTYLSMSSATMVESGYRLR
jgi:hypothetical protein